MGTYDINETFLEIDDFWERLKGQISLQLERIAELSGDVDELSLTVEELESAQTCSPFNNVKLRDWFFDNVDYDSDLFDE